MTEIETRSVKETKKNRQTNCWEGKTEKSDYVMTGKKKIHWIERQYAE